MGATIIVLLLIALIPASIASKKGKSFGLWYVYGVCLWIVALIHSLVLPDESQNQNNNSANNSYKPYEPITKTEPVINTVNKVKCTSVDINAKVRVQAWDIEKNSEENIYLKLNVLNTTSDVITALSIIAKGFDSFNNPVLINNKEKFSVLVQDLRLLPNKYQEIPNKISLPDSNIRKIELYIQQICYEDGKIESLPEPCYIQTCQQKMDVEYIPYAQKINKHAKYYMIDQSNYWQCICGEVNTGKVCFNCKTSKEEAKRFSKDNAQFTLNQMLRQEEEEKKLFEKRQEEQRIQREKNEKQEQVKKKKNGVIAIIAVVVIICTACLLKVYQYNHTIKKIETSMDNEQWDNAMKLMGESSKFKKLYNKYGEQLSSNVGYYDKAFGDQDFKTVYSEDDLYYYNTNISRNGLAYKIYETEEDYLGTVKTLCAIDENDRSHDIYTHYEHAYDTYDNDVEYIMWTNDWIIIQDDEDFFALKCDKSGNVSEVDLSDNLSDFYDKLYIKMADGNIVVADAEYLDEIDYDTNLMYFNTKKGSFTETSYERLEDKYDVEESWEDCILYKKYVD